MVGWQQRPWVLELHKQLAARVDIAAIIVLEMMNGAAAPADGWQPSLFDKAYIRLEHVLFGRGPNPLTRVRITANDFGKVPLISAAATVSPDGLCIHPSDKLRKLGLTVGVAVGPLRFSKEIHRIMPFGALVLRPGHSAASSAFPGFIETIRGDEAMSFGIDLCNRYGMVTVSRAAARKSRTAVRNAHAFCRKAARFVAEEIVQLPCGRHIGVKLCDPPSGSERRSAQHLSFNAIRTLTTKAAQFLVDQRASKWMFAYSRTGAVRPDMTGSMFKNFRKVLPPSDRFWADPFPVVDHGRAYVFVEEFLKNSRHAHISLIELDGGNDVQPIPVVVADHHLSYPFILRWRHEYFMVPESSRSGRVEMYRATRFPFGWTLEGVLLSGVHAADATICDVDGTWWLFASEEPSPDNGLRGDTSERLLLFYASTPLGPWHSHRRNPVKFDIRSARPAGGLFRSGGRLFRPAQDCAKRYGHAININEVLRLTTDEFQERTVSRITPTWTRGLVGTHTVNADGALVVVDGRLRG